MSKRILIIDNDKDMLTILSFIFEDEGYEVISYNTGKTAEYIQLIHPDIILLDVRITGYPKTGCEICTELKSYTCTANLPVVLISAEYEIESLARKCGADDYISKPFDISYLLTKVDRILNAS